MRNKSVIGLVIAAVLLLLLAGLLTRSSVREEATADGGPGGKRATKVVFPRDAPRTPRHDGALATDKGTAPQREARADALQRALLAPGGGGAIFVEANAIRHTPLVDKMLRCRADATSADGLSQMKRELGVDPLEDVDRVGFDGDVFVASGFFQDLKVPAELGEGEPYGDGGRIWRAESEDGTAVFGRQGDGLLVTGSDEAQVKAAMDRAAGKGGAPPPALPAGFGEGEVYGTVGATFLAAMLGGNEDPLAQRLTELVTSSTVRMNVDEDAALSLDLQAVDEDASEELSKAMGGAFAALRMQAQQNGDAELAQLLEQARVKNGKDGRLDVDVAVPGEVLLRALGCGPEGEPLTPAMPPR